ncbi:MAG TPA: NnrS family protein, partial [Polyangiales bacterium]
LLDCAFAPALALWVSRAVLAARSRHNYGFVVLLATVCTGNVLMHAAVPGWLGQALFVGRSAGHQDLDRVTPCARTPGAC